MTAPRPYGYAIINGTVGTTDTDTGTAFSTFTPGQKLYLSYFYQATRQVGTTATVTVTIQCKWFNSSGTLISTTNGATYTVGATIPWTRTAEDLHTPPSGAVTGQALITVTSSVSPFAHDVYVTGIRLATSPTFSTSNNPYVSTTAPTSPVDGDYWLDTSSNPNVLKIRVNGAWQVSATNVTNTNQITDGAGLGTTAAWTSVSGRPTSLAALDAAAASQLGVVASDDYLTRSEKSGPLKNTIADVESRYQYVLARAGALSLSTSAMTTARSNFYALLGSYSPAYNDYTQDTTIYSHFFADKLFTTGWTVSIATTAANGAYTTLTDPSTSSWATVVRSKSQPLAATQYTIGMVVKKDSVPRTTRYPLMRLSFGGGTAKQCDWNLDTSTGDVGTTSSNNWDAAGVFDLGNDWLLWGTATSNTDNNIVQYAIYPCVGASSTLGSYNAAVTGSVDVMPPLIVQGNYTKLGHFMLTGLLKAYTDQIETLWKSISGQDATTANWPNITGTGKPADNATVGADWGTNLANRPGELTDGRVGNGLSAVNGYIDFNRPHINKNLDTIGDGATYGRPVISRLNGGKPWIDFAEPIHSNKNVDNIDDGATYARLPVANSTGTGTGRRALIDLGNSGHLNVDQDHVGDGATYTRIPLANTYGTGTSRSAKIDFSQPHVNKSLTYIGDDANYAKVSAGRVNAGRPTIDFSETIHANKNLANVDSGQNSKLNGIAPNAGTPLTLRSIGSGSLAIVGNGGTKTTATSAWDTAARSNQSFRNSAYMTGRITAGPTMIGLTTDNSTVSYTGLTAAFYYDGSGWYLYSNGSQLGSISASSGNALSIEISDQVARWYVDGSNVYNMGVASDQRWFFGAALCNLNSAFADVTFGQSYGSYLSVPGSGVRIGDARNLPTITGQGARYKYTGAISYSAAAGSPATATISVAAGASYVGSNTINYNAMSTSTSATGGTVVTYFLYFDDPNYSGGTKSLVATTDGNAVYQNDARVWVGSVDVTYPTSGASGGGGTGGGGLGGCVSAAAWVETLNRGWVRGGEVVTGDMLRVLNSDGTGTEWKPVLRNTVRVQPAWRITSVSGITLTASDSTPLTLRDGSALPITELNGHELPVQDENGFRWEPCSVAYERELPVAYISLGGLVYAAGDEQGRAILTHNTVKP